jgi:hypothetical protein
VFDPTPPKASAQEEDGEGEGEGEDKGEDLGVREGQTSGGMERKGDWSNGKCLGPCWRKPPFQQWWRRSLDMPYNRRWAKEPAQVSKEAEEERGEKRRRNYWLSLTNEGVVVTLNQEATGKDVEEKRRREVFSPPSPSALFALPAVLRPFGSCTCSYERRRRGRRRRRKGYSGANAVNEEDPGRDRATQV